MNGSLGAAPSSAFNRRAAVPPLLAGGLLLAAFGLHMLLVSLYTGFGLVNLPLLVAVNLMLRCREPISAMFLGMLVGCAYDGLTHGPVGLYGIVYTMIGYPAVITARFVLFSHSGALSLVFAAAYFAHEILFLGVRGALVGGGAPVDAGLLFFLTLLHAGAGLLVFTMLSTVVKRR